MSRRPGGQTSASQKVLSGLGGARAGNFRARKYQASTAAAKTPATGTSHGGTALSRRRKMNTYSEMWTARTRPVRTGHSTNLYQRERPACWSGVRLLCP